jgi:hypothetical protein
MDLLRKTGAVAVALLLLAAPAAACVAAGEAMTQSEEECCREMAGDCGKVPMQASHSCCSASVSREQPAKTSSQFSIALPVAAMAALVPEQPVCTVAATLVDHTAESPPPAYSPILRI